MDRLKEEIRAIVEPAVAGESFEVAEVVLSVFKKTAALRVFVYGQNGVSMDDCARLSTVIGDALDRTDFLADGYTLEVSSPGLDRPLVNERDFRFRIGETVKIQFADKKKKKVKAEIISVNGNTVEFEDDSGRFSLSLDDLESARIVF